MVTQSTDILARLVERVEGRYFGKYRGEVTSNDDPDNLGRVKARVPRLFGDEETGWALPAFPYGGKREQGFFVVPDVGSSIWVEFEEGYLSHPIWSGVWYGSGELPESASPAKKVLKTKSGHKLVLDDDGGSIEITDSNDNSVMMDSGTIRIKAGSAVKIVVEAPQIELVENATHPLVFGDQLLQYLNQVVQLYQTHVHPGQTLLGLPVTPAPPAPPLPPATRSLLSRKVKTG
jgi:uncharacterized protein involved in type VI secretion and phage assembly